jgi:PST family polysaccharide transporter
MMSSADSPEEDQSRAEASTRNSSNDPPQTASESIPANASLDTFHQEGLDPQIIRARVQSGTRWLISLQILSQLFSLAVLYILYRWVETEEFGYLGMALPAILIVRLMVSQSLSFASVQAEQVSHQMMSNLFWATIGLGIAATMAGVVLAPLLEWLYAAPQLKIVVIALAGTALVSSLSLQHQSILERRLQIEKLALIRFVALFVAGLAAIWTALTGWGIWALVLQQYVELIVLAIGSIAATRFLPSGPRNWRELAPFLKFGGDYFVSNLFFNLAVNLDKFILAYLVGSSASGRALVGMYTQAYNQMMKPVYLVVGPISSIMFPALSRAQSDAKLYHELTRNFFRLTGVILLPCGVGLFVVAEDAFVVLGGAQWKFAGQVLAALSLIVLGQGFINICGGLFAASGKTRQLVLCAISMVLVLAFAFGLPVVMRNTATMTDEDFVLLLAWTYTLATLVLLLGPYVWFCLWANGVSAREVFASIWRSLISSLAMGFICWLLSLGLAWHLPPLARLITIIVVGVVLYLAFARKEISWAYRNFVRPGEQV